MDRNVKVLFDLLGDPIGGESVWAERVSPDNYRLLNVPFHATGYAENDVVLCHRRNGQNEVVGLVHNGGNGTIRLMFSDAESSEAQNVLGELTSVGCTLERASNMLVAVTVPPTLEVPFSQLVNYLNNQPDEILLGWEIGKKPLIPTP